MKNKLPIIITLLFGIAAIFVVRSYIEKIQQDSRAQFRGERIIVAREDLKAGAALSQQILAVKEFPSRFLHRQSIKEGELGSILSAKIHRDIRAGDPVLWSDFESQANSGFSATIPQGEGVYTVSITRGIKPGLVRAGDHIDIVGTFTMPKQSQAAIAGGGSWKSSQDVVNKVLLQNVTVLSIGDSYAGAGFGRESSGGGDLTLSVSLREAQVLMFAAAHGELGAVLRREGFNEVAAPKDLPRITFETIEQLIGEVEGERKTRSVELRKGLNTTTQPVFENQGNRKP